MDSATAVPDRSSDTSSPATGSTDTGPTATGSPVTSSPRTGRRVPGSRRRLTRPVFALKTVTATALLLAAPMAGVAYAEPPAALPASHAEADGTWQPAFDYDTDGCYPTPAIGPDGTVAEGLNNSGALNGECRDQSDLDNTNSYSRSLCDGDWCAYLYDLYFEKDQAVPGLDAFGHRHDIEHVVVWVNGDEAQYVSVSAHGDYSTYPASEVQWEGTHPKIVYHKDGASTHCFRIASTGDEPPENHYGTWQYPDLVSWDHFPDGIRDTLVAADFGSASLAISDGAFESNLEKAKPEDIPFDPHA
ncbi:necrosis inducing protein (NPP1) [Prauserella rugosa]|uniref:Necrosis inducing protein (NPP1) n=2 Tax=Prauserella rugosa TaxID=43354 RepID=A0A660CK27_9PSEU|nr:Necrosis inducing protein (NPP1) [Prauserella sp. Am3]TWH22804.1 necrosis inducing protein (NPP1) [Prauserella rugosa]